MKRFTFMLEAMRERLTGVEKRQKENERLLKIAEGQIVKLRKKLNNRRWVKKRFAEYSG